METNRRTTNSRKLIPTTRPTLSVTTTFTAMTTTPSKADNSPDILKYTDIFLTLCSNTTHITLPASCIYYCQYYQHTTGVSDFSVTTTNTIILRPLYRTICVSRHSQLRTGGLCRSKVLLPTCPCWQQLAHSDYGDDVWDLLNGVTCTISIPSQSILYKNVHNDLTRHTASTSMYSLTFCVRVMLQ